MSLSLQGDNSGLRLTDTLIKAEPRLDQQRAELLSRMICGTVYELGKDLPKNTKTVAWMNTCLEQVATCEASKLMTTLEVAQELALKELRD